MPTNRYGQEYEPVGITAIKRAAKGAKNAGAAYLRRESQQAANMGNDISQAFTNVRQTLQSGGPLERRHVPIYNPTMSTLARRGAMPFSPRLPRVDVPDRQVEAPTIDTSLAVRRPEVNALGLSRPSAAGESGSFGAAASGGQLARAKKTKAPKPARPSAGGPRVYSDGSGGIPKTDNLAPTGAGSLNVVPSSAITRPLLSDSLGHTASFGEGVAIRENQLRRQMDQPLFGNATPEMFARARATDIASGDPRSTAGRAAGNLRDAISGSDSISERQALQRQYDQFAGAMQGIDASSAAGRSAQGVADTRGNALVRGSQIQAQGDLAQQGLAGQQNMQAITAEGQNALTRQRLVNQGDENIAQIGADARVTAAQAGGRVGGETQSSKLIEQLNKGVQEQIASMRDMGEEITPELISTIRAQNAMTLGQRVQVNPETGERVVVIGNQVVRL